MMNRTASLLFLVLWSLTAAPLRADSPDSFFFKKGDRIVFLGDSITEQYHYSSTIELYLTTRFPTWDLTFLNAGIGGDTATGGAARFERHVLAEKPTAVTINFGMNDGGYGAFDEKRNAAYVKHIEAILRAAQKAGVRVALLSPNAVDYHAQKRMDFKRYLETQKQFYAPLKDLAAKSDAAFVDQYAITRAALEKMQADGAAKVVPFGDGFHTAPSGGLLMAHAILTGLHAPATVSEATIDAAAGKATTERCKVQNLKSSTEAVSFTRTDDALPMPIAKDWQSLLPYVNELRGLNWYGLKVTGLKEGKYSVAVEGKPVATFTATQLAEGVNLGNLPAGPIFDQGKKVFDAINAKNQLVHKRFRGVVMKKTADAQAAEQRTVELGKRMEEITDRQQEIYKLAKPVPRRFEVRIHE